MSNNQNLNDLRKLRAAVQREADALGLNVVNFQITPGAEDGDNDVMNVVMAISVEAMETIEETEQRKIDSDFDAIFGEEFGDGSEFVDDDTKALIEAEAEKKRKAQEDLQKAIDEMDL